MEGVKEGYREGYRDGILDGYKEGVLVDGTGGLVGSGLGEVGAILMLMGCRELGDGVHVHVGVSEGKHSDAFEGYIVGQGQLVNVGSQDGREEEEDGRSVRAFEGEGDGNKEGVKEGSK